MECVGLLYTIAEHGKVLYSEIGVEVEKATKAFQFHVFAKKANGHAPVNRAPCESLLKPGFSFASFLMRTQ